MKKKPLFASALFLASASAMAYEPHNYTYIEASYWDYSMEYDAGLDNNEIEGDGYAVAASYQTEENLVVRAYYAKGEIDSMFGLDLSGTGVSIDSEQFGIFVGGGGQVNERTSVVAGMNVGVRTLSLDVNDPGFSLKGDADIIDYGFTAGARFWLTEMIELNGSIGWIRYDSDEDDLDYSHNDVIGSVGVRFQPISQVSIGANYTALFDADDEQVSADIRYQF